MKRYLKNQWENARIPKVIIPMIRRVFPELIAAEIVGVQPMSAPTGVAFALDAKYSNKRYIKRKKKK